MITTAQLGQQVKAKYGEDVASDGRRYADIDDYELGQLVIKKYPVYEAQVSDSEQGKLNARAEYLNSPRGLATETVKDVGKKAIESVTNSGKRIATAIAAPKIIEETAKSEEGIQDVAKKVLLQIQKNKKEGKDTKRLEKAYNEFAQHSQANDLENILPSLNDSNFDTIMDFFGMGLDVATAGTIAPAKQGIKKGVEMVAKKGAEIAAKSAEKKAAKMVQENYEYALDLTMPQVTKKEGVAAMKEGRVTDPGLFSKASVTPTPRDNLVAESVQDIVSAKNSVRQNVDAINQKMNEINSGVKGMIADRKIPFNRNQLRARLNANKEESRLVFASDATAERVYDAVVDEFMKHVGKKDTLGLFEARQSFDKIPAIKKLLESEGMGENVRRQIVLDVRRAANEYVAEQLPKNNPYRDALMRESRMFEALENIAEKNWDQIGKNKIQSLIKQYPGMQWALGSLIGGSAALGASKLLGN